LELIGTEIEGKKLLIGENFCRVPLKSQAKAPTDDVDFEGMKKKSENFAYSYCFVNLL
jgi:hypothetical protein